MKITIEGDAKEIAAFVLAIQERQNTAQQCDIVSSDYIRLCAGLGVTPNDLIVVEPFPRQPEAS